MGAMLDRYPILPFFMFVVSGFYFATLHWFAPPRVHLYVKQAGEEVVYALYGKEARTPEELDTYLSQLIRQRAPKLVIQIDPHVSARDAVLVRDLCRRHQFNPTFLGEQQE